MATERSEFEAEQELIHRMEEHDKKELIQDQNIEEILNRENQLEMLDEFARVVKNKAQLITDSDWVKAAILANMPPNVILDIWDKKDDMARQRREETSSS